MTSLRMRAAAVVVFGLMTGAVWAQKPPVEVVGGTIDLPSSKQINGIVPGGPQRLSSLPVAMAVSPDGRFVVTVNAGYGSVESEYSQALAVMDTRTGKLVEFPDLRTMVESKQVLYSGLAFSGDGRHLYASMVSMSDPQGTVGADTGSGIAVYSFSTEGKVAAERVVKIAPQKLAAGRTTLLLGGGRGGGTPSDGTMGLVYPAAIAVVQGSGARGQGTGGSTNAGPSTAVAAKSAAPSAQDDNFVGVGDKLLVAGNLSDDVLLVDAATGAVITRFDLSEDAVVPSVYPIALTMAKDGTRAFVGLWNGSEVVELDLGKGTVGRKLPLLKNSDPVKPGSHPDALAVSPDGKTLYVALGNRDAVAAVDIAASEFRLKGYFDVRLPGQSFYGAQPEGLAVSADGMRLYSANMGTDSVAVLDTRQMTKAKATKGMIEPVGFIPTEWLPMGVAVTGGKIYVATGKGVGTGPNNMRPQSTPASAGLARLKLGFVYIPMLLHGSLAAVDERVVDTNLRAFTRETLEDERLRAAREVIGWDASVLARSSVAGPTHRDEAATNGARSGGAPGANAGPSATVAAKGAATSAQDDNVVEVGGRVLKETRSLVAGPTHRDEAAMSGAPHVGPIRHVIYIIRENRTYDQELGDLGVGNGDKSLTMYGADITPNLHKLAMQFGVLDNFYDSAEVSGDGHVWSNSAIGTDYLERAWELNYRGSQHGYDFEGVVSAGLPLEQKIPDVNEPNSGYIWGNVAKHGMTLYHFGEFISSKFCTDRGQSIAQQDSSQGPMLEGTVCKRGEVKPGEKFPEVWGGGVNKFPWAVPLIASNTATKPELVGHFAPEAPDFNLKIPDQVREDIFEKHLAGWVADKAAGKDTMPNFIMLRLPNDHTAGTTPGSPTPKASIADNDLAVGRAVEAISHTPFWEDTAFFILEDDAQNGADHVDAHRSIGLIVSKYAPHAIGAGAFVDSRFYSTVSMVRTMETVLGLPPMNNNDALSSLIGSVFTGPGDQAAFTADRMNEKNGLIYTANTGTARGARDSAKMDFTHADRADSQKLNVILWQDAMGDAPVPSMLTEKRKKAKGDEDDRE